MSDKDAESKQGERKVSKGMQSRIQAQIERAKQEQKKENFKKRLEIARKGLESFRNHKLGEAAKSFHTYIKILEEWNNVGDRGLRPTHFNVKTDKEELLLINGIYWDLAKLYDRTQKPKEYAELKHYLSQYVLFTKGMEHQALSTETLRKYLSTNKALHKADFEQAFSKLGSKSGCFIATALVDVSHPQTLPRLKAFRDQRLDRSTPGRIFIAFYYQASPLIVKILDRLPNSVRHSLARKLDRIAERLS